MTTGNGLSRKRKAPHRMWPIDSNRWGFALDRSNGMADANGAATEPSNAEQPNAEQRRAEMNEARIGFPRRGRDS